MATSRVIVWPVIVAAAIWIFRDQITSVLDNFAERLKNLASLKGPGFEATFDDAGLLDNRKDVARLPSPREIVQPVTGSFSFPTESTARERSRTLLAPPGREYFFNELGEQASVFERRSTPFWTGRTLAPSTAEMDVAQKAPPSAISQAFTDVSAALEDLAEQLSIGPGSLDFPGKAIKVCDELGQRGILENAAVESLRSVLLRLYRQQSSPQEVAAASALQALDYAASAKDVAEVLKAASVQVILMKQSDEAKAEESDATEK